MLPEFQLIVLSPPGVTDARVPLAASSARAVGVADLCAIDHSSAIVQLAKLVRAGGKALGVRVAPRLLSALEIPIELDSVILTPEEGVDLASVIRQLKAPGRRLLLEATSLDAARAGAELGVDGVIAKGHEAGGWVGEETTLILLQRILRSVRLPVWAQGGIGLHTIAACYAAGAAGAVMDSQFALTRESSIDAESRALLARMDGSETACLGGKLGAACRMYCRGGLPQAQALRRMIEQAATCSPPDVQAWRNQVAELADLPSGGVWLIGQDAAFAASLANRFPTVAGIVDGLEAALRDHVRVAKSVNSIGPDSALARSHGTRYPIVQGPMTRVSDTAAFALEVAKAGGLPFLALALMRAEEVSALLQQVGALLEDRPWGVGILGFVPPELRREQMDVVRRCRPPFALIAGGRPDQSQDLEQAGIRTYLHVPSPALLRGFLEGGARRFVFEGRECGGHVGPRSSFVLWNLMVDILLESLPASEASNCHVLFAGGIHDALSASMAGALAAPLVERGIRVGTLLGTAYLFTSEAVSSGAIVPAFQAEALRCDKTVLLESGVGHAIRCVETPYAGFFEEQKANLQKTGKPADVVREQLEELNVGRLRSASKGVKRSDSGTSSSKFVSLTPEQQRDEGMYMIGQAAALRDQVCSIGSLHHDVSALGWQRLQDLSVPAEERRAPAPASARQGVAIVGIGCLLPKASGSEAYWHNILNKVDAITEVPAERWDWRMYFNEDPKARDKIYSRWGGFLDEIVFDPLRYGMPPASLASIEPLQLLTLEAVRMALDDAGYSEGSFPRERTSVILGVGGGSADLGQKYALRAALPMFAESKPTSAMTALPEWSEDSFAGILLNVAAGRVANRFNLGGVNYTVDAACASSLAALYLAMSELETGRSDLVITGGADTLQSPFTYLCFSKTSALSPRGRCRPFDATADGIAISEGLVMLVLKRLSDAERDGDRIYAVVKGVAGSSDGKDKGLTAPRRDGQVVALNRAYAQAGISPAKVTLVEAHGTGTVVGDRVEIEALTEVFRNAGSTPKNCALGSVKSMIGHTKCAAGVAGLAKAALALHHKVLPPTCGVEKPNQALTPDSPFYVNAEARPWIGDADGSPRVAAVSAFGFGGTNFHAVLEEHTAGDGSRDPVTSGERWPCELMWFAADSPERLSATLRSLDDQLGSGAKPHLHDLAYTLWQTAQRERASQRLRLALVVSSLDDLRQKLGRTREILSAAPESAIQDASGIYFRNQPLASAGKIAFLFPGQGSQYPDMLSDLARNFSEVRQEFEAADRALSGRFPRPLSAHVFPPPRFGAEEDRTARLALMKTDVAQPALGAADIAVLRLLQSFHVDPDVTAGHSYGEYVALCAAGVFSDHILYELSETRGRFILECATEDGGEMASVDTGRAELGELLSAVEGVWIANLNAPNQTIISGTRPGIREASAKCEAAGVSVHPIAVSCAFHSPIVATAKQRLADFLKSLPFKSPTLPVYSNATAGPYPNDPAGIVALLSGHLASPVDFVGEIEAMYQAGVRIFVEAGPRNVLTGLTAQILGGRPHSALAVDVPGRPGIVQLAHVLGQLAVLGVPVDLDRLYRSRSVRELKLASLVEETQAPSVPATAWLVSGGRARPRNGSLSVAAPAAVPAVKSASNGREAAAPVPPAIVPAPIQNGGSHRPEHSIAQAPFFPGEDADRAILRFQEVMTKILDTQREVMLAYLQSNGNGAGANQVAHAPALKLPETATLTAPEKPVQEDERRTEAEPAPAPRKAQDSGGVRQVLLRIVSEQTGYPTEALGLDLKIEADLGVDSLKTAEILAAFQQSCPPKEQRLVQDSMDKLTKARTLGAMIEFLERALHKPQAGHPGLNGNDRTAHVVPDAQPAMPLPRFFLAPVEAPVSKCSGSIRGSFVITDDERGVASLLAERLRREGAQVALVQHREVLDLDNAGSYTADLSDPASVAQVVERISQRQGGISGIVHLLPLKSCPPFDAMDSSGWRARLNQDIKAFFLLTGAAAEDLKAAAAAGRAWLASATTLGGDFGITAQSPLLPSHGGLAGMMKTLAIEWPAVRCVAMDFDTGQSPPQLAGLIFEELAADGAEVEVGYRGSTRFALKPSPSGRDPVRHSSPAIDSDSVILVTGGGRGITAKVAFDLARRYRPTLLIVGRAACPEAPEDQAIAGLKTPEALKAFLIESMRSDPNLSPAWIESECSRVSRNRECRANLAAMREAGASVKYFAVDVTDEVAFGDLIRHLYRSYGRIDGVIHGAGIIDDKLIENKTAESFDRVFETKVISSFVLSRELHPESLKFLAFFSSIAACFGSRGQADYAAANGVVDKLATHLDRTWPARVFSINWGPWGRTGMVSPALHRQFAARGIDLISPEDGAWSFDWEIQYRKKGEDGVILGSGPWSVDRLEVAV